ncbi:MAG TPA: hypothetical protein DCW71_00565 [Alistipes sp.]|nr:hypothetical protein BN3659_02210 [Alistipes sp. CHKCI003]HAW63814.1 hypothetical protein [Alistipes sp.]
MKAGRNRTSSREKIGGTAVCRKKRTGGIPFDIPFDILFDVLFDVPFGIVTTVPVPQGRYSVKSEDLHLPVIRPIRVCGPGRNAETEMS